MHFVQSPVTSFFFGQNIFPSTLFSETINKCSYVNVRDSRLLRRLFDISFCALILIDVIVSWMLCSSSSNVWRLFEYTLSCSQKRSKGCQ
jgi:hypothetical protein